MSVPVVPAKWRDLLCSLPGYDPFAQAEGCWFEPEAAQHAIDFIEACIRHVEGDMAGKPFLLERWQKAFIANLFGWKKKDVQGRTVRRYREVCLYIPRKNGKMLGMDTPLPTPLGWTTIGEVKVGDTLFDERGEPCSVLAVHPVDPKPESYLLTFSNGEQIKACADHLWLTTARVDVPGSGIGARQKDLFADKKRGTVRCTTRLRTTREVYETQSAGARGDRNHAVLLPAPLVLPDCDLPVEPYVLGVWLGDGNSSDARITCAKSDIELLDHLRATGIAVDITNSHQTDTVLTARLGSIETCRRGHDPAEYRGSHCRACEREIQRAKRRGLPLPPSTHQTLQTRLRGLGLLNNKHIPEVYLRASPKQRLALLQGLMDTDGSIATNGQCEFSSSNPVLAGQVRELLATLGVKVGVSWRQTKANPSCRMIFSTDQPVFRLSRKLARLKSSIKRAKTVQIVSVEPIAPEVMRCITVSSPSGLYLCGRTMLPTHNTPLSAAIALYVLFCDEERGQQDYVAAADREQAGMLFRQCQGMVNQEPELLSRCRIYGGNASAGQSRSIVIEAENSFLRVISADANSKHGGTSHLVLVDELHAQPNRDLVDVLQTSMASANRKQPLLIFITTADFNRPSICNEKHEYACKVRDGIIHDPSFLPVVYEITADMDWTSPEVWARANPNLGVSVSLEYLERECKRAKETPAYENTFKRLHLNLKTETDTRAIPMDRWDACGSPDPKWWRDSALERLRGQTCFGGLDLGSTSDLTALALLFREQDEEAGREVFTVLPYFWVPKESARRREHKDRVPYETWIRQGWVFPTDGNVTDYAKVRRDLNELAQAFGVRELAVDRLFQGEQLCQQLAGDGFNVIAFGQGFLSMAAPVKKFLELVLEGTLRHGSNPVLRWMASNASTEQDPAGNLKFSKKKSTEKIDGVVAACMSLGRAMVQLEDDTPRISVW